MNDSALPPIAISMGEPAGVGPEIILKSWRAKEPDDSRNFFALGDLAHFAKLSAALQLQVPVQEISNPEEADAIFPTALPVLNVPLAAPVEHGIGDEANGAAVMACIEKAVRYCQEGRASALVTAPINKAVLYKAGFRHPGHTEYVADLSGGARPVMMLACPQLRTIPITIHLSILDAVAALNKNLIVENGRIAHQAMKQDFGLASPRLAFAGLNPHAGENGSMGREEIDIIIPALEVLRAEGIDARGPFPADTMFHAAARQNFDVALCMYHDQANIPLKTIGFEEGVNITLGLPVIRTSPDHGTAFDIAGKGLADPASLIHAIDMAREIARHRADV